LSEQRTTRRARNWLRRCSESRNLGAAGAFQKPIVNPVPCSTDGRGELSLREAAVTPDRRQATAANDGHGAPDESDDPSAKSNGDRLLRSSKEPNVLNGDRVNVTGLTINDSNYPVSDWPG